MKYYGNDKKNRYLNMGLDLKQIVGNNLKELRKDKGYSREALSRLSGVSLAGICSIEYGKRWPRPDIILALTTALEAPWQSLFVHELGAVRAEVSPNEKIIRSVANKFGYSIEKMSSKKLKKNL